MAAKKIDWMSKVSKLKGAVNVYRNVHDTVIQTKSPSLNFIFGNGWGLPLGYSVVFYGPPKSGKSLITYALAGAVHSDYPDGWVLKFNTEYREEGQLPLEKMPSYGIDMNRYKAVETNHPGEIYDQISNEVDAWCKDGWPLKLVIIDSTNGVQGRRTVENEKGIMTQQIGDVAMTNKEGMKQLLAVQRKHRFGVALTSHVAIEMDQAEQKRGNKWKMGTSVGVQHLAEYFCYVEQNVYKAGHTDHLEQELVDQTRLDITGRHGDQMGHKIKVVMKDSSMGPKGRCGEFTFGYNEGIVNTHEEAFLLGYNRGIITKDAGHYYDIPGYTMPKVEKGQANMIKFMRDDPKACEFVVRELKKQDLSGAAKMFDRKDEAVWAAPGNAAPAEESSESASG
jgi:hypothetical protein